MNTAECFKTVRKTRKLSQRAFADRIGKSQGYVSRVESGSIRPDSDVIRTVCETFDINPGWFFTGDMDMEAISCADRIRMIRR